MARTVWKFPLPSAHNTLDMPAGAIVRHVAAQGNRIMLWAEVDPDAEMATRKFEVVGTGHPIRWGTEHVGSLLVDDGAFVFHVYEVTAGG